MDIRYERCRSERWLIKPLTCPRPVRHCSTCGVAKEFICSERFRVNAQKKLLDVWLHYRCSDCGGAWKYPVLERQSIATLDVATYEAYVRHDPLTVWKHAFDVGRLRAHVALVAANVDVIVERSVIGNGGDDELRIHLDVPYACDLRLDRLLVRELRCSRAKIQQWYESGQLRVLPEQSGALSKRVRTGQQVWLHGAVMMRSDSSNTYSAG